VVTEYITGIKAAWEVAKALKIAADSIDNAHIKLQIAELISALADAKIEAAENSEKIIALEKQLRSQSSMWFDGSKYFHIEEDEQQTGPFCATCFDLNRKEIRLQNVQGNPFGDWHCRVCNGTFT
jgi:hypothetical protein